MNYPGMVSHLISGERFEVDDVELIVNQYGREGAYVWLRIDGSPEMVELYWDSGIWHYGMAYESEQRWQAIYEDWRADHDGDGRPFPDEIVAQLSEETANMAYRVRNAVEFDA